MVDNKVKIKPKAKPKKKKAKKPKKKVYQVDIKRNCINPDCNKEFTRREVKFYSRYCSLDCFYSHTGANHGGRDMKYTIDLPDRMMQYYKACEKEGFEKIVIKESFYNDGEIKSQDYKLIASKLPFLSKFCEIEELNFTSMTHWVGNKNEFPELVQVYKECKEIAKRMLINNGLSGTRNPAFNIFIATNLTDLKSVNQVQHTGKDGEALNVQIYVPDNNRLVDKTDDPKNLEEVEEVVEMD